MSGQTVSDEAEIRQHIHGCTACLAVVAALAADQGERPPLFADRYELSHILGQGAFATVRSAWDTRLERTVAIKLYHARAQDHALAEARALAQLEHESVVRIYDVGETDDRPHVAMELVVGETLRAWLRTPREPRQITAVLSSVARGLAAAHGCGVVHRDVKPDNVVVRAGDRAVLVDFGLALRWTSAATTPAGSPAYMPPEVLAGGETTSAADIYALSIAIREAYDGILPTEPVTAPTRRLPRRLHPLVAAGLLEDPDRRPSAEAFVVALGRAHRPRRGPLVAVGLVAAVGLGSALLLRGTLEDQGASTAEACAVADEARSVRDESGGSPLPEVIESQLVAVQDAATGVCAQSDLPVETRILRDSCLRTRLAQVRRALRLTEADPSLPVSPTMFSRVAACVSDNNLGLRAPLPSDASEGTLRAVAEVRESLAEARLLLGVAKSDDALAQINAAAEEEIVGTFPPLGAEVAFAQATVTAAIHESDPKVRRAYNNAASLAAQAGHDWIEARAWTSLTIWASFYEPNHGEEFLAQARAHVTRLGKPGLPLLAPLASAEIELHMGLGHGEEALEAWTRVAGDGTASRHPARVLLLSRKARILELLGRFDEALQVRRDRESLFAATENPEARVLMSTLERGQLLLRLGRIDEASELLESVLESARENGADPVMLGMTLEGVAAAALQEKSFARAKALLVERQRVDTPSTDFAKALRTCSLARAHAGLGELDRASQLFATAEGGLESPPRNAAFDRFVCIELGHSLGAVDAGRWKSEQSALWSAGEQRTDHEISWLAAIGVSRDP